MSEYSIWCEKLQKNIKFDSFITVSVEMFNITAIANYFGYTNKNIVDWFNTNIDTLHIIDSIITEDELDDSEELLSISDFTINKIEDQWYVNINVLIEYLRDISFTFMCEFVTQFMFDKVITEQELNDMTCEWSEEGEESSLSSVSEEESLYSEYEEESSLSSEGEECPSSEYEEESE